MIRVVLVDDQTLVRQGIRSLLELADDVEVVAEAGDGQAGLAAIAAHRPDVVLLDLRMPVLDGLGVLEALDGDAPAVLVLTTFDDDDAVLAALRAGARGYLLKDVTLEGLLDAIRTVAAGGRLIQPAVTAGLLDRLIRGYVPDRPDVSGTPGEDLTPRELDVLRLMAAGWSNREIAHGLHLAEGTVKNHVSAVLLKLGVHDRTRAVLRALDLGLIGG